MDSIINCNSLLSLNLVVLGCVFAHLVMKGEQNGSVTYLAAGLTALQLGSYQFGIWPISEASAGLIALSSGDDYLGKPYRRTHAVRVQAGPFGSSMVVIALVAAPPREISLQ